MASAGGCAAVSAREKPFSVHLIHADAKHNISLDVNSGPPTVQQFATLVAGVTMVPIDKQRLIFKGRSLTNMSAPLHSYGMKSGCKVMVLGRKTDLDDDVNIQAMCAINAKVSTTNEQLDQVIQRFNEVNKTMLTEELDEELLSRLDRQLSICIEHFTLHLEQLDGLSLAESNDDVKTRRKSIVLRIQTYLDQSDALHDSITSFHALRQDTLDRIREQQEGELAEKEAKEADGKAGSGVEDAEMTPGKPADGKTTSM